MGFQRVYKTTSVLLTIGLLCVYSSVSVSGEEDAPIGSASLAFVFDITGSMYDDLLQVIDGAAKILETAGGRRTQPLYNYVLVPFHDPDIGPVIVTTDAEEFQEELRDLYVQGGGDCPEMSVGAIKTALEVSLPNSFIYVFTDARAKDYYLTEDVLSLIQQKQSQVVFVLTGDCGNNTHRGFKAYEDIASTSSGQVFLLKKSKVNEVLEFVRQAVNARKVNLMSIDKDVAGGQIYDLPIDTKLKEVTVSVSGTEPRITLVDPSGRKLNKRLDLNVFLNIPNALIYNVKDPVPGAWKLQITSRGPHTIRVTGLSTVDFQAGFSKRPAKDISETDLRPIQGIPTHLLLNTSDIDKPATLTSLALLDLKGSSLAEYPVYRDPFDPAIYNVSAFVPPDNFFYIKVDGIDAEGYTLRRTTPTAISPRIPTKPRVFMPETTRGFYDSTAEIVCNVDSLVPYSVRWFREGIQIGPDQYYTDSSNATLLVPRAGKFSEGDYICNATNLAGFSHVRTFLDISEPPPVISPPRNVSVLPGKRAYLTCHAFSNVDFYMTWTKTGVYRNITYDRRIRMLPNTTLEIRNVRKQDEGEYTCEAINEGGATTQKVFLRLQVPPLARTRPREQNFVVGQNITVNCVAEGYPKPRFTWLRENQVIIPNERYLIQRGRLTILNVQREEEGDYECFAKNTAGEDTATARLSYIEAPRIQQYKKRILVANGDKAELYCEAYGIPPPNITWYRGDRRLQAAYNVMVTNDGKLIINNVQQLDAGNYKCIASNEAGRDSALVELEIGSPPRILPSSRTIGIEIERSGVIPCTAEGSPPPKIIWRRGDGKPFNTSNRLRQLPNGGLEINRIQLGDEGIYTCLAQNPFGTSDKSTFVSVTGIVRPLIAYSYPFIKVLEGETAELECTVLLGKPKPKIGWTKNGRRLSGNRIERLAPGKIKIKNVRQKDDGEYVCVASNIGGNATYHVTVDVIGPPKFLEEKMDKKRNFTVIQGRGVVIPCRVNADPRPSFTWFKDGSPISLTDIHYYIRDDGSLEIFSTEPQDSAQYKCVASNVAGEVTKDVNLFVQIGPTIDGASEQRIEVIEGKPVVLSCDATGNPQPTQSWRRNFTPFSPKSTRFSVRPGGMYISKTKVRDKGIYECVASNKAGNTTKVITLVVYIPPSIEHGETSVTMMEGDPVLFECETFGEPAPSVVWKKNDTIMDVTTENSRYLIYGSGSLAIDAATLRDAGRYSCLATNPAGSASVDFSLTVHAVPHLPEDLPNYTEIIENNPVILPCPATGTPTPRIVWLKNAVLVTGDELGIQVLSDGSLEIKSVDSGDTGEYRCMAINIAGNATQVVDLKILVPPKLRGGKDGRNEPDKTKVIVNNTVTLRCPVADDVDPRPSVLWYKNERPLRFNPSDVRVQILNDGMELKITQAEVDDTARYKCVATNIAGAIEQDFDLDVQVPPMIDSTNASPDNMSVVIGQPLYINCPVSGIPPPQVTWYKDDQVVSPELDTNLRIHANGRRLEIVSAKVTDRGRYQCVGENVAGETLKNYTVDVYVPPRVDNPGQIDKTEVITNQTIKLTCPASGIPPPNITWFIDNRPIKSNTSKYILLDDDWTLTVASSDVSDTNRYICRADNIAGENEKVFDVNVLVPPKINRETINSNPNVIVNTTAVVNCPVSGIPTPEISWYRNGMLLDSTINRRFEILADGRQLRIHSAKVNDRGRYTCSSRNRAGEDSVDFNLNVWVPPKIDDQGINHSPKVIVNSSITIECPASGVPPPQITWYKDSQPIDIIGNRHLSVVSQGTQLVVQSASLEDAGRYTCVARNEAGEIDENFELDVQVPPSIPDFGIILNPKALENDSVTLDCPALGHPPPEIIWLQNGQELDLEENPHVVIQDKGRRLVFNEAQVSDAGIYTCVASNEAGTNEKNYNLDVWVPPSIDSTALDNSPRVIKGHTATISCPVSGIPFPNITWISNGLTITDGIRFNVLSGGLQLRIQDTTEEDSGVYQCIATNPAGSDRQEFELVVLVPPTIDESNVVYNPKVIKDRHVILECPVSGNPVPEVQWLFNGAPVQTTDRVKVVKNDLQLEISRAQVVDSARYSCIATNEAGELRRNFQLEVLVPPEIDRSKINVNESVIQNKTLYLDCPVTGIPPPSILWLRNTVALIDSPFKNLRLMDNDQRLEISNAQVEDSGTYTCKASNGAGRDKVNIKVDVHVPPSIEGPMGVSEVAVKEEESISLYCNVSGIPPPVITWSKNNNIINPQDENMNNLRILLDGKILKVLDTSTDDTARYICQVRNEAGVAEKFYNLEVLVPPKINGSDELQVVPVIMDLSVRLECPAVGIPTPVIRWYRQGKQIPLYGLPNVRIIENGRVLVIISAQLLDFGDYSCEVQNDAGQDKLEFLVSILVPPEIRNGPRQVSAIVNAKTILECETSGQPRPDITWEKDGESFPSTGLRHRMLQSGSLEFLGVQTEDTGEYTCTAFNDAGNVTRSIGLSVSVPAKILPVGPKVVTSPINSKILLPCEVEGSPKPKILWLRNRGIINSDANAGYTIMENGSLYISNIELYDTGVYTCIAQNLAGNDNREITLEVQVPPKIDVFQKEFTVLQNRTVVIPCSADGIPSPKIRWQKDGKDITPTNYDLSYSRIHFITLQTGGLAIPHTRAEDAGTYTCFAINDAGNDSVELDLVVQVPPQIQTAPRQFQTTVGDEVELPCDVKGNPKPWIDWSRDGRRIDTREARFTVTENGTLIISDILADDTGRYVCTASNIAGRDSQSRLLRVQVPPRLVRIPRDQQVTMNSPLELHCGAVGVPTPAITWQLNGRPLASSNSVNGRSVYLIRNAMKEDAGQYTCIATNPANNEQVNSTANVIVTVPPRVKSPGDRTVSVRELVMLSCSVVGDEGTSIIWTKNGRQISLDARIQQLSNGSLVIYDSTASDAGEYKCIASNDAGTSEGVAMLTVRQPPVFKIEPANITAKLGDTVIFDCTAEGEPKPDMYWWKNTVELQSEGRITILPNNSLRIVAIQLGDSEMYRCFASNNIGKTAVEAHLLVVVDGDWSDWDDWGICSTTCGIGVHYRTRNCSNPPPANGGKVCLGQERESSSCAAQACPVDGNWGNWGVWDFCSMTCGPGVKTRTRLCNNPPPQLGGAECEGNNTQTTSCSQISCPINGGWGEWGLWNPCSLTCGEGYRSRDRNCDSPRPQHNGLKCVGSATETEKCLMQPCAVDGSWGDWDSWSSCTLSCGGGWRTRSRSCDDPAPQLGGNYCVGSDIQRDYCNSEPCPVHGNWSPWDEWNDCSATCGGGQMKRYRYCNNPKPGVGGRLCSGQGEETATCNPQDCPIEGRWGPWEDWSDCTKTCDGGIMRRRRICIPPQNGGRECLGDLEQVADCNEKPCNEFPILASGNLIGNINNIDIEAGTIVSEMIPSETGTRVKATILNVPKDVIRHLQHLVSVLSPIYWTTATEKDGAFNGFTLTEGNFKREVQVEFATGEVLKMNHYVTGMNQQGELQFDVVVQGNVPDLGEMKNVYINPYVEDYVQTGPGSLYASSSRLFRVDDHIMPYAWNHTITYDEKLGNMPYLVETLKTSNLQVKMDGDGEAVNFQLQATIGPGEPSNKCPNGFDLNPEGPYCLDDDECLRTKPCSDFCHNSPGSFSCSCQDGFVLQTDGKTCTDVDECEINVGVCSSNQICVNTLGSYACSSICLPGFVRAEDGISCKDINECELNARICSHQCTNTVGSYQCSCKDGYRLTLRGRCFDINECRQASQPCSHRCINMRGSFKCACSRGYRLTSQTECEDIDECAEGSYQCRDGQKCKNTAGRYICENSCPVGYQRQPNGRCQDINECAIRRHQCLSNQRCINFPGGYRCACPPGLQARGAGHPCTDINECERRPPVCSFRCLNKFGSFECICPFGQLRLADKKSCAGIEFVDPVRIFRKPNGTGSDYWGRFKRSSPCGPGTQRKGFDCVDIDECAAGKNLCQHNCTNTPGSYICDCPKGYRKTKDGFGCKDINECIEERIDCGEENMCFNQRGSYTCISIPCPKGYVRDPTTDYCVLECVDPKIPCPPGSRYTDTIQFKTLALPSGVKAHQDLVRLLAYNQREEHLRQTLFRIIENDPKMEFRIRIENGKGVVYTLKALDDSEVYRIMVKAQSYDNRRRHIQYQTTFIIHISVSAYPY